MTMSDTSEPHTHNQPDTSEPLGLLSTVNSRRQKPIVRTIQQLHSELGSCYIPIIHEADISQMLLPNIGFRSLGDPSSPATALTLCLTGRLQLGKRLQNLPLQQLHMRDLTFLLHAMSWFLLLTKDCMDQRRWPQLLVLW